MKYFLVSIQLLTALFLTVLFFACSPTTEKVSENDFFEPVEKVVHRNSGPGSAEQVITRERYASGSAKEEIMAMLRDQNKQLNDVVQRLNSMTKKDAVDTSKDTENLNKMFTVRDRISNEMLLEMIREQNQRLNDVLEQLKLLSQNQQNIQYGASSRQEGVQVERTLAPLPSPKQFSASLAYGKAIRLYQQQNYRKGIESFTALLKGGVDAELQDNCHFWMGVCYFHLNMIDQAMAEFTDVQNTPGSDKREGACFMIGQCYEQMGNMKYAKNVFEKMLRKYPGGSLKQMAEIKLALLK